MKYSVVQIFVIQGDRRSVVRNLGRFGVAKGNYWCADEEDLVR